MEQMSMAKAINEGLRRSMAQNDKVLLLGEDIAQLGGVFRVTDGLLAEFGPNRVMDTPLAESGIIGTCIGLAMRGYRLVPEIQFDGFVYPAFDQITTQLAKLTYRHEGKASFPVVIRIPMAATLEPLSTTRKARKPTLLTRPGFALCHQRPPRMPTG
jgi:2-oxoisovalerate dehydrogenase E1 component beta subunit